MIDVRFPTALQLMLNLALAHAEGVAQLSSTQLAGALGTNPSLVRKLLSPLANSGLVRSSFGRDGGIRRPAGGRDHLAGNLQCRARREEPLGAAGGSPPVSTKNVIRA
jgi:hypothetical protein